MKNFKNVFGLVAMLALGCGGALDGVEDDNADSVGTVRESLTVAPNNTLGFGTNAGTLAASTLNQGCGSFNCNHVTNMTIQPSTQRIYGVCLSRATAFPATWNTLNVQLAQFGTDVQTRTNGRIILSVQREVTAGDKCAFTNGGYVFVNSVDSFAIPLPSNSDAHVNDYSRVQWSNCAPMIEGFQDDITHQIHSVPLPGVYNACLISVLSINPEAILLRSPNELGGRSSSSNLRQIGIHGLLMALGFGERTGASAFTNPTLSFFTQNISNGADSASGWLACQLKSLPVGTLQDTYMGYANNCP